MFIQALVLQKNNDLYLNGGISPGTIQLIPTANQGGYVFSDYWAIPVAGGIVSGLDYEPCEPGDLDKPDPQAFHVVRISSTKERDSWVILGNSTQYMDASQSAECCESPGYDMPTTDFNIFPCQELCADDDGNQFGAFGLPYPDGGTYTINGFYNGTALPQITGAAASNLVTNLNANGSWNAIGTWAKTDDNLTLTVTGAAVSDPQDPNTLCLLVTF